MWVSERREREAACMSPRAACDRHACGVGRRRRGPQIRGPRRGALGREVQPLRRPGQTLREPPYLEHDLSPARIPT
eukprot:362155-Chlamydomonas_euryale.AAC.2